MFRTPSGEGPATTSVIIGAGGHGLAAAYYLAKDHGIKNVAVLEKGYIGGGNTGRNTHDHPFQLSDDRKGRVLRRVGASVARPLLRLRPEYFLLDRGHFTLAHSDSAVRTMRWRAESTSTSAWKVNWWGPKEIEEACPHMDLSCGGHAPILGALYHAPGAIARHDAVAWGYGRVRTGAVSKSTRKPKCWGSRSMADASPRAHQPGGYRHDQGAVCCRGFTPRITDMVGIRTPIYIHPLQAMVSEPMKPWLDPILVSGSLHVYVSQSARGELVMGASLDPTNCIHPLDAGFRRGTRGPHAGHVSFSLARERQSPVGGNGGHDAGLRADHGQDAGRGFYLDAGWGTWGFKATPVSGKTMAHTVAHDRDHELIEGFRLSRFAEYELTGEKGAASVGH
jgi:sarcosine oxidase subunit beta